MPLTRREFALSQLSQAPLDAQILVPAPRAKRTYPESELQQSCVKHYRERCRLDPILRTKTRLFAIAPHDGKKTGWQRDFCKRMGQVPGPHDLQFLDKREAFTYYWIECKSLVGRYTDEQKDFAGFLGDTPVRCSVVRTLDEFLKIICAGSV